MSWSIDDMCKIVAQLECRDSMFINLGIGLPTKVVRFINTRVLLQSENGVLGLGPAPDADSLDPDLINAGKQPSTVVPGGSCFDSSVSFGMIRSGRIDLTILGGMEVSRNGDLANWMVPGDTIKGMGGAMDLVSRARRVVVLMRHFTKERKPKLREECSLPLTGTKVVDRLVTEYGVFDFDNSGSVNLTYKPAALSIDEIKTCVPFEISCDKVADM